MTLKELSKLLGVSISTVSKSLNNSPEISETTKQKVLNAAKEFNYRPNYLAKSLKARETKTIGVIIPDVLNYFFVKVLVGIEFEARKQGYKVVTCISSEKLSTEIENIKLLTNGSVDGIIISLSRETQTEKNYNHLFFALNSKIPIVQFDRVSHEINCDKVLCDDYNASQKATEYLINNGCKSLSLALVNMDLSVVKLRAKGFWDTLQKSNFINSNPVLTIDNIVNSEEQIVAYLRDYKPDAIFCVDELLSVKIVKVANKLNIKIPKQLKIIGFSNGQLSEEYYPSISSIDLHAKKIGEESISQLISNIKGANVNSNKTIVVPASLVHRSSTNL